MSVLEQRSRPNMVLNVTISKKTGCGNLYTTVTYDEDGALEVFAKLGHVGDCSRSLLEALTRCISQGLRYGVPLDIYIKQLKGIRCKNAINFPKKYAVSSCSDALGKSLEQFNDVYQKMEEK